MSSHSPTICNGGHGFGDTSITFGRSVLDGEVPYPADMAGLPSSTPNPSAVKRKTRKSWFETTPSGSKLEIAVEKPVPKIKRLSGEVEVLTLTHFTAAPRLDFGTMKPGQVKTCTLLLRNPHECEQTVKVEKVPEKKHFTVASKSFSVGPGESYPLEVTWSPPEPGNFREMILMQVDKSYRLQAYVFGSVTAPPQKKKKRVGLLASKVSKPFSVIQTSSLASISHQYSPEKTGKTAGNRRRSGRLSGQGVPAKPSRLQAKPNQGVQAKPSRAQTKPSQVVQEKPKQVGNKKSNDRVKETNRKKSLNNRENIENKPPNIIDNEIPKKKMRRSNTYSNVSNQGLLIPVIQGDRVQGQMDTSLIDIVDKCNVSGIQALEQSLNSPEIHIPTVGNTNLRSNTVKVEKPSFLENQAENRTPDLDKILRQVIPNENQEPSFLEHKETGGMYKQTKTGDKPRNLNLQIVKDNETFHDSLENCNISSNTNKYTEQPSFLSPADANSNQTQCNSRSTRRSAGKINENDNIETTEVRLLRSAKRRSGRRSITKENRRSWSHKSPGAKSIVEQLKSIRTFIKEKSFEIESGDEHSFLKPSNMQLNTEPKIADKESCTNTQNPPDCQMGQPLRRETFLADTSKMKVLESQKPSEASPRRTTFTVLRKNTTLKSPARSKSEGHRVENVLAALDEAEESSREQSNENVEIPVAVENIKKDSTGLRRKSKSPKRLYSADSLEDVPFEPMFHSPKQIKLECPEFERRVSTTVTKSRPSDALLYQMEIQTAKLFETVDTSIEITGNEKIIEKAQGMQTNEVNKNSTFEKIDNSNNLQTPDVSFPSTPTQIPTSPNPDHSRRSTHVVKQPKVVDQSKIEQKQLFQEGNNSNNEGNQVSDSPANNTRRQLSGRLSGKSSPSNTNINSDGKSSHDNESEKSVEETEIMPPKTSIEQSETQSTGLVFIPMNDKDNTSKESNAVQSRPKTVVDPKHFLRKRSTSATMPVNTMKDAKRVKREKIGSTGDVGVKSGATDNNKKPSRETRLVPKGNDKKTRKPSTTTVKGLAQSKLILVKKTKTALPKHPLPFAAKNMYYDERWMEKQERGFVNWLNFVLTPAEEYQGNDVKVKVDAGKLSVDVAKGSVKLAPTNEVLSFRAYSAHRKLNRLRKSACRLFQSESVVKVIQKLEGEVESGRLAVRKDKMLHADLGAKQKILDMLLSYNPLWLRIGIETIYGEIIPLQTNSDVLGLSRFILTRLLTSPDIIQEYAHPTVPHLYRDGYAEATAIHSLKKFLMLVYFLDRAKQARLIDHNPCLFCKNSDIKASKDLLHQFSRDLLSGEGDITRHLGYLGYKVTYTQTALDEFDFAVSNLGTDLRDGLRLTKVMELLCNKPELSKTLRVPAISRLQKVHNVDVVFKALTEQSIDTDNVTSRDIVDGHREKSLKLLWNIILHYQVEILLNETQLREEIDILEKSLKVKNQLQRLLKYTNSEHPTRESEGPDLHTQNPRLNLLLKWCRAVCAFFNIKVENFTVSFSDGRALCHIVHYYHPGLLPLSSIHNDTSITHMENLERNNKMESSLSDSSCADFGDTEDPEVFQKLLCNERENFKLLFEKVKELGGIPLMLKWSDMSNTIPDEKVVVTYLLYLCARLLDIRHESRAARIIQLAWRKYRVKTAEKEFLIKERAAVRIQKKVREFLEKRRHVRRGKAALVLQRVWKGYQARKLLKQLRLEKLMLQQKHAVCLLQRAVLGYLHRRRYLQMKAVVTQFQACCRGYLMRKQRIMAATKIQSAWRSHTVRKHVNRMKDSIVKIQSCIRGHNIRKIFTRYKEAVVMVQRRFRAKLAMEKCQRDFVCVKRSCVQIQRCWRNYIAHKNEKREKAAVTLQSVYRGYLQRREYLNKRKSVISMQAAVRGYIARAEFLRQRRSVITLQRQFRNYLITYQVRMQFLELKYATVFLQAQRRMVVERRRYKGLIMAVVKIQACVRMFLEKIRYQRQVEACRYLKTVGAAITIQAAFRGHLVRKKMGKQTNAAVVIQAFFRQIVQRRKYLSLRSAVLSCQERVRANIKGRQQRREYQTLRQACVTVQKLFRGKQCRLKYLKDKEYIIRLQASWKMVLERRSYLTLRNAACLIQRRYRAKKRGDECRRELQTMSDAARMIQSVYRGYCIRKELDRQNQAATIIQAQVKGLLKRKRYQRLKQMTIFCQQIIRAKLAGKHELQRYKKLRHAAVVIQKFYRAQKCRSVYKTKYRKIVTVQAVCRMFIQRQHFLKQRQAVVVIQRRFRAMQLSRICKNNYNTVRTAAITLQAAYRGLQARRNLQTHRQAAVCIQKYVRGFIQRRKYGQLLKAVCNMQRLYRTKREGVACRREYMKKKSAIVSIQATWRGYLVRREMYRQHTAAVCIQKYVKASLQRRKYRQIKNAAIKIQRFYMAIKEGSQYRRKYLQTKSATMTIQSVFRGYRVRKEIQHKNHSATRIQACYRRHVQRCRYLRIKQSVLVCQRRYRANILCEASQRDYETVKHGIVRLQALVRGRKCRVMYRKMCAARIIQSIYRMYRCKKNYQRMKYQVIQCQSMVRGFLAKKNCKQMKKRWDAAYVLQVRWRAKVKGEKERKSFLDLKKSVTVLQKYVRAKQLAVRDRQEYQSTRCHVIKGQSLIRGYLARIRFNELKKRWQSARILQTKWRARVKGQGQRKSFLELKKSAIIVQKHVRAMKVRQEFQSMRNATIKLQSVVRGMQQRKKFMIKRQSVVKIQSVFRGYQCRKMYTKLRTNVIMCQRLLRAKTTGQAERKKFHESKRNIVKLQSVIRGFLCRKKYQRLHTCTVKIQSVFRGYIARKKFITCRKAAIILQRYWRAELLCRKHVFEYQELKDAAVIVQKNYRAKVERENFLQKRSAIMTIQINIRVWASISRLRELLHQRRAERAVMLERIVKVAQVNRAAIQIQRCYRNYCMMKTAREKVRSVTLIQRWVRGKLQRLHYLRDRRKIVCLQTHLRCWLVRRNTAACKIQRAVRKWMATFEDRKKMRAARKIQAVWKGYSVRRRSTSKKIIAARKRVMEANASATEENKLCNRTASALDYLLKFKHMSYIIDALKHLEVATRLSWSCCERMVDENAVPVLYRLIRSCNRSLPHQEIIQITVDIMLNLAKYDKTRVSLYEEPDSISTLIELMQIYRQKAPIFIKTCTLFGIMCLDCPCKTAVQNEKKMTEKLRSIHNLTSHKHKIEETQRKTRARMNATLNMTMMTRSPVKRHKIKPDWSLHKDKMKEFDNPLKAINFVLVNLGLSVK